MTISAQKCEEQYTIENYVKAMHLYFITKLKFTMRFTIFRSRFPIKRIGIRA